jgi:sphingomyelin phosphodiesterase
MFYTYFLIFLSICYLVNGGNLLHVTDIHYDIDYHEGAPTNCILLSTGMRCCHKYDIPTSVIQPAGKWGDYNCDSPKELIEETFAWIRTNLVDISAAPNLIIYTGDSADHHVITQSPAKNLKAAKAISNIIQTNFPTIPTYTCHGNHDTYPIDQTVPKLYPSIMKKMASYWSDWLDDTANMQFRQTGYYSQNITDNLLLVAINTLYYDDNNLFKTCSDTTQWDWLTNTLEMAQTNSQSVWLIGHIFPNAKESTDYLDQKLYESVYPFRENIKVSLFGHSHNDQFIIVNNAWHAIISSSLIPSNHHACFRMFEYDDVTYDMIDYTQYCADIYQDELQFVKTYRFTTEYNVPDARFESWKQLYENMQTNQSLLNKYYKHYKDGYNTDECEDTDCKKYMDNINVTV